MRESNSTDMPEQLPEILEADIDDFCYLMSQGIMRLLEEEDAANRRGQKHSQDSGDSHAKAMPVQAEGLNQTSEEDIDQ